MTCIFACFPAHCEMGAQDERTISEYLFLFHVRNQGETDGGRGMFFSILS